MITTAAVKELVLQFEAISSRYQSKEWLSSLERLVGLGAEPFLRLLSETSMSKEERPIRWVIAVVLGRVGDAVAVEALCRLLNDFPSVQSAAAGALGRIGDSQAVEALVMNLSLQEDPKVIREVGVALAQIGDIRAIEPMRIVLSEMINREWGGYSTPKSIELNLQRLEAKSDAKAV